MVLAHLASFNIQAISCKSISVKVSPPLLVPTLTLPKPPAIPPRIQLPVPASCFRPVLIVSFGLMDGFEGFKHHVVLQNLNVRHLVEPAPVTLELAREIRYCVIAICVTWATVSIFRTWTGAFHKRNSS
jgi:hypothetical protein